MRTNNTNLINLGKCSSAELEGGICLTFDLPFEREDTTLPVLAVLYLDDKNGAELDKVGRQLDNFDYEIRDMTFAVYNLGN